MIMFSGTSPDDLNKDMLIGLQQVTSWLMDNRLTLNIDKTKFMIFGTRPQLPNFNDVQISLKGNVIERVKVYKYLGVILDEHLSWANHIDHTAKKISKKLGFLRRSAKPCLPQPTFKLLSSAMVLPLFDYCDVVWSSCSNSLFDRLSKLHNRLARMILSAHPGTHISDLHHALSWTTLHNRWHHHRMHEVFKCVNNLNPCYLNSLFTQPCHSAGTRSISNGYLHMSVIPKTNAAKRSFQYLGTLGWNKLTAAQRKAHTLSHFKHLLN